LSEYLQNFEFELL